MEIKPYPRNTAYSVGSDGSVYGPKGALKASLRSSKKPYLAISTTNPKKTMHVHIMVAEAFIGPCPKGQQVAHKNGDPTDNRLENIQYLSCRENILQKHDHGTMAKGDRHGMHKLTEAQAIQILSEAGTFASLGRKYGVDEDTISHLKNGRTWKHLHGLTHA